MCGRYNSEFDKEKYKERFEIVNELKGIRSSYNVRPGTINPTIVAHSPNHIELMVWGFIPSFALKDPKPRELINVRTDSLIKTWVKKSFEFNRCIIGVKGFYEPKGPKGTKNRPQYYFSLKDGDYIALAGIYMETNGLDGKLEKRYAIITKDPESIVKEVHDREPWMLNKEDEKEYLNPDNTETEQLLSLARPFKGDIQSWRVSNTVNKWGSDGPDLIQPLETITS